MGFYPPASLVRDAQRRGVEVRPPDVNASGARCALERGQVLHVASVGDARAGGLTRETQHARPDPAVRVGLAYVSSVGRDDAEAIEAEREANGPYRDVGDLARRARVPGEALQALVRGGACDAFGRRRDLLWELGLATARSRSRARGAR